jgi:outer membrane lipoprotein-sorting protein
MSDLVTASGWHARRLPVALVFAAIAGVAVPAALAGQDRGLAIIEGAAERYRVVGTLCAEFQQHLAVPLLATERTGTGRLCQTRPNLFAMRFTDPAGDAIVADGDFVWVYLPSNDPRTVLKTPADRTAGGRDYHREFLEDPASKYEVRYEADEEVAGRETHRIRLVPKVRRSYRAAVIWIDRDMPVLRQIRLEEENGNVRTITLTGVAFEARPGEGFFRFTPPANATVISG